MKKTIAVIALIAAPALASAQAGLSRIEFLALQQELRDQGCGVTNVDGRYGPQTRRAIATCAQKFNSANNARALLVAMNIGFGPNDNPPTRGTGE
jgi:peptidoglycan hydrolase-like protein with peptidoglycan-binding domain